MKYVIQKSFAVLAIAGSIWASHSALALPNEEPAIEEQLTCSAPDGWLGVEARGARFVVFGEIHGTAQAPQLVSDVICGLALREKRVLLAIEFSSVNDPALQEAWNATESGFRHALERGGWERRDDGVGSVAMRSLVERAHVLKSRGAQIDIVAFNGARDDDQRERFADLSGQGPHEAAQAENIANAADAADYDAVIVLVGNFHAKKDTVAVGNATFETMASRLEQYGSVISLNYASAGGTSWNCQAREDFEFIPGQPIPEGAIVCGSYSSGGSPDLGLEPFIALSPFPGRAATPMFDGYFWLGHTTASAPAFKD
jgi:hypothetical protein